MKPLQRIAAFLPARRAWLAAGLLAASGALVGVGFAMRGAGGRISTDDAFVEGPAIFLAARVAGQVLEAPVEEHARVRRGDLLARLDPADFQARVARAEADLAAAHNRVASAHAEAAAAEAEREAAESERWRAEREAGRVRTLFDGGAASRQQLDAVEAARSASAARVTALELRAAAARAQVADGAPVRQAEAALREAKLALEHAEVRAPFDGVVGRKNVEPGAIVSPGQPLLYLAASDASWVVANFKETQVHDLHVGDPAEVRIDAYPGTLWRGHVASFSPATGSQYALLPQEPASGNFTRVVQRVPVRIALDAAEGGERADGPGFPVALPVGLSAEVTVVPH